VIGPRGAPLGFTMIMGDEIYQPTFADGARRRAAALIADARAAPAAG
jgi:hypothetical protein